MTLATKNKIRRLFAGRFTEKGELIKAYLPKPKRYHCYCNANGFTAGQIIRHHIHCIYHPANVARIMSEEHPLVRIIVAIGVFALCFMAYVHFGYVAAFFYTTI